MKKTIDLTEKPITTLPPAAVSMLQRAAQTPITPEDPLARVKAVEQASTRVRREYPQFFKEQQNHEDQT